MKHIIYFAAALIMVGCASNQKTTLSGLDKKDFDTIVNNQKISLFTLQNGEMEACITNYGGRIVSLMVPDKDGSGMTTSVTISRSTATSERLSDDTATESTEAALRSIQ